jgi:hypothetical protein
VWLARLLSLQGVEEDKQSVDMHSAPSVWRLDLVPHYVLVAGGAASSLVEKRIVDRVLVEQDRGTAAAVLVVLEVHGHEPLGHALSATLGLGGEEQVGVLAILLVGRAELEADEVLGQLDVAQRRPLVGVEEDVAVEVAAHRGQSHLAGAVARAAPLARPLSVGGGLVVGDQLLAQEAERVGVDRPEEGRERRRRR